MSRISKNWKTLSQKVVLKNRFIEVWEDQVQQPDGKVSTYYVRRKRPFSIIIPFDGEKYHMIKQFRYHVKDISLEFPMGSTEGKGPYDTAVSELEEEMGMQANLLELGWFWLAPGVTDQQGYVYLATDITQGKPTEPGEFFEYEEYTFAEINQLIIHGAIKDGPTIVAFQYLRQHLNKNLHE